MLQQAKQDGDDVAGVPFTAMHTQTAMNYLDADKAQFERGGDCYTTIPDLEAVVEKHYAWDLPADRRRRGDEQRRRAVGLPRLGQRPLQDGAGRRGPARARCTSSTRTSSAAGSPTRRSTSSATSSASRIPHDTIGGLGRHAARTARKKTEYWDGFSWTFDSTAAPTTYAFDQLTYSILDQETIARGHLAYYLKWTNEALEGRRRRVRRAGPDHDRQAAGGRAAAPAEGARRHREGAEALRGLRLRQRDLRRAEGVDRGGGVPRPRAGPRARARPRSSTARAVSGAAACPSASPSN